MLNVELGIRHINSSFNIQHSTLLQKMKFISWNVNGLRACVGKDFENQFKELDADFFCLQETKMQEGQLDLQFEGYESYWYYAEKKGYSGTAIYTKHKPLNVNYGMGVEEHDHEGRIITLEYDQFYLVTCYTPNSQTELKRLDYRMTWEDDFRKFLKSLDAKKPVVICGDLNVAHEEIDIKNPKTNRRNAGFTDEEREKMTVLLNDGFTDSFRYLHPDEVTYSWWSYRFKAREKNAGWRIDYFLVSDRIKEQITEAKIHTEIMGSDHCPVEVDLTF
jgi:exodeoxyribonuclease-3